MPMRNRSEMLHETLLSRYIMTQEDNVKITDLLGGSNNFATLSQALAINTSLNTRAHMCQRQCKQACLDYAEVQPTFARQGNIRISKLSCKGSLTVFMPIQKLGQSIISIYSLKNPYNMKKKLLPPKMLATFAALLFLMTLMPLTAKAQNSVSTITTTENITKTSTVYVGEVVVDGQTTIKYLYSGDLTIHSDVIQNLNGGLNGISDGDYADLFEEQEFDYDSQATGFAICSNPDLVAEMDENWNSAQYVGTLYFPAKYVTSEINSNLYDIDNGFKVALDSQAEERSSNIDTPVDAEKRIVSHLDSRTITDVYYTIEDGRVVRHSDITVIYDSEATTVIYTKVELSTSLPLADAVDNSSILDRYDGETVVSVTLADRTLYKDGTWNTLCLPFALDANQIETMLDSPAQIKTLNTTDFDPETGTLTLNFVETTTIEAGKPYIIKWTKADGYADDNEHNLYEPTFTNVMVSTATEAVESDFASFIGTTSPMTLTANDRTVLYLSANNTLYWPSEDMTINSCRAYFELKGDITAGDKVNEARAFCLNFGDGETTAISRSLTNLSQEGKDSWYSIDGRRISVKPTAKGIYINNGHKLFIK